MLRPSSLGSELIPIVEYPSIVTSSIPWFEDVFTDPQLKNFKTYVSGLILSPIHTISYMNSIFYAHSDQSALNNFMTRDTGTSLKESGDSRKTQKAEESYYTTTLCRIMRAQSTWSSLVSTSTTLTIRTLGLMMLSRRTFSKVDSQFH